MVANKVIEAEGWRVQLDLETQILRLDVPEWAMGESDDAPLSPTLPATSDNLVSAAALLLKAKQFDDGLYAAVDLAAQQGAGRFVGKVSLLQSLALHLSTGSSGDAAVCALAACSLGGVPVEIPPTLKEPVERAIAAFLADEQRSKPLGFYNWSAALESIFRQDRFLQQKLDPKIADAMREALSETPGAIASYDACLRLMARLTNRLDGPDVRETGRERCFFPASRSHEGDIVRYMFGDRPIPDGFDLMTEFIRRIRSGDFSLEPSELSGWYDHQTWSLEPLLVPDRMDEARRLLLEDRYRQHLEDLFRSCLALARETHVKQLAVAMGGYAGPRERPIRVLPDLAVEPLPSLYTRRAACYRFIRSVLEEAFGVDCLRSVHRLTSEGPCETTLADELRQMEALFAGASAAAWRDLGAESPSAGDGPDDGFASWRARISEDRDVARDARMMVPVFYDRQRGMTKVWAFLGWRDLPLSVAFHSQPTVLAIEKVASTQPPKTDRLSVLRQKFHPTPGEAGPPRIEFGSSFYELATPVMAEVYVSRLLNRDEFRRHCDHHKTRTAILANLS
jgi:hypothetical protein